MKDVIIKVVGVIVAIAALAGIKIAALPGWLTAVLIIIVLLGVLFIMGGGLQKKKVAEK